MKITTEMDVRDFKFWSGGKDRADGVRDEDWGAVESCVEEYFPDGCTDSELNDFFWFDFDIIAQACGYENEEHYFYGAAKDESDMFDVIKEKFPNANDSAVEEWCADEWCKSDNADKCFSQFEAWYYSQYAKSIECWVDMVFEEADGTVADMKEFIKDKDLNEKTAEEWLEEYNEWCSQKEE